MSMCILTAQARTNAASRSCAPAFSLNSSRKWLFWYAHVHVDYAGSHKTVLPLVPSITTLPKFHGALLEVPVIHEDLDRGIVEILVRRCCEDPDEILSQVLAGSCAGPGTGVTFAPTSCGVTLAPTSFGGGGECDPRVPANVTPSFVWQAQ